MRLTFCIFICVSLFFTACKKDKDTVTLKNINGIVFNNCTDSGLANVTVYLQDGQGLNLSTVSDANGNFSFNSVQIHSDNKYSYRLYIPSKSGTGATTPEYCSFTGESLSFTKDETNTFFKPRVTPGFLYLCYTSNIIFPIVQPDSLNIYFEQKTFHKNVPNLPYSGKIINSSNISSCSSNYPMGWWVFSTQKWKSGNYTFYKDSLYIGWGGTKTYTINW
jgi:hypothetical protein